MSIEELAKSYLDLKLQKEEKSRYINYDMASHLRSLQKTDSTPSKLEVIRFKSEIQAEEDFYDQLVVELNEKAEELKPLLIEANVRDHNPLVIHVQGQTHFDTYLDDDDNIVSSGYYSLLT